METVEALEKTVKSGGLVGLSDTGWMLKEAATAAVSGSFRNGSFCSSVLLRMLSKLWNGAVESMHLRLQPAIRMRRSLSRYFVVAPLCSTFRAPGQRTDSGSRSQARCVTVGLHVAAWSDV